MTVVDIRLSGERTRPPQAENCTAASCRDAHSSASRFVVDVDAFDGVGEIGLDARQQLGQRLLVLLVEPLERLLLGLAHRFLDGPDGLAAGLGQEDMGLPRVVVRGFLVEKTLRLQPVDRLGDGRRPHAEARRQLAGRLAVLLAAARS